MGIRRGPATVTGERTRNEPLREREGRGSEDPEVRILALRLGYPTGARTPEEVFVNHDFLERRISSGEVPLWSWAAMALLLVVLFVLLSASGDLLAPLLGQVAGVADYLHEFAHDGRHLLGVPCH